ncbi:ABC transporter substrate-binding protein [Methanothermococcus sp. SCGC AD-155-M21]|nr:ABC transporter substrate-binding protein [Methanothermococcus sp. SCGC AD-155-M21]
MRYKSYYILISLMALIVVPTSFGLQMGDINNDEDVNIADVVYLFKNRDVSIGEGDLNCDDTINIADVVYLFKNYNKFRSPLVFAEKFTLEPEWDTGYCYLVDSNGNKFVLVVNGSTAPDIPGATEMTVPVQKIVVAYYSPVISTADILNNEEYYNTMKGVPEYAIRRSPKLTELHNEGKVVSIGKSMIKSMNYELVLNISPEVVFLGDMAAHDEIEAKLKELNIPVARSFTYDEPTFLGRLEWAKFVAAFWGKDAYNEANEYFQKAWYDRNNLLRIVRKSDTYPTVVNFFKFSDTSTPSVLEAQNFRAKLIEQFHGRYVFNDIPGTGSKKMDTETFMERAKNTDVVILRMRKDITSKEDLLEAYPTSGFENFKAFKESRFYVSTPDYYIWEARDPIGYMEDYAKMIHPELFPDGDNNLKYHIKIT